MPLPSPAFAASPLPPSLRAPPRHPTCRRAPAAVDSPSAPSTAHRAAVAAAAAAATASGDAAAARPRVGHNPSALLTMGLPKGSLLDSTLELMGRAGWNISLSPRSYYAKTDDEELNLILFRSQEMARYVAMGCVDCGIAGLDWILEEDGGQGVVDVGGLNYSKGGDGSVRWVLAVKEASPVRCAEDLTGGIISTELIRTTQRWFEARGIQGVRCEFSWGATEIKARAGLVDAICDVTETGDSIRANGLRIVDVVMESGTRLIANEAAWADPARRAKIEEIMLLLDGALQGRRRVGIKMNVPVGAVDEVRAVLDGFAVTSPTVSGLVDERFVSMEIITEAKSERLIIPKLKLLGCLGIFSYNLNMLVA